MSETEEVLGALDAYGSEAALVTIIGVKGSTYRREGAKLVVPRDGEPVGNISGGCLEGEVTDAAREVLDSSVPRTVTYDLTADDEVVWGWGLGCNGVVEVFIEPAGVAARFAEAMRRAHEDERALALVTIVDGERAGARVAVGPDGSAQGSLGDASLDEAARTAAAEALGERRSRVVELPDRAFVEVLEPALHLVVCGAGHDAIPLVEFGARLGWKVEVLDDRKAFLDPDRFPGAASRIDTEPTDAATAVRVDERTHVVVMSHNFLRDRDYLRAFLPTPASYIGMLGPKARLERLLAELRDDGFTPQADDLARVHGPAGLDIGAEGPEEIAWSIVAEILAVRRASTAGFLRDRSGPIHPRSEQARSA